MPFRFLTFRLSFSSVYITVSSDFQQKNILIPERPSQMAVLSKRIISTTKAPAAMGYSQAVLVSNQTLKKFSGPMIDMIAGMEPGKTELVPGGARAEAKQAMTNIGELLQAGGSSFKHVVFAKILLADMSDFQAVNETFKSYFTPDTYPARSLCQVVKMPKNGRVKIDVVAIAEKP
ncbi:hypothetical protein niasHT_012649 [Heterodera trifolii]|uniref:Translation initiation inhibitor n=1 Tax=Heterodera trifolii TaxID=157864 RepID=A0ABD2L1I5_9BILA